MKKFEVFMDKWTGRDRWSGPEDAGMSLHLTEKDYHEFVKEAYKDRDSRNVPEYYENADGSLSKVFVSDEIYKKIVASKNGIRYYGNIKVRQEVD